MMEEKLKHKRKVFAPNLILPKNYKLEFWSPLTLEMCQLRIQNQLPSVIDSSLTKILPLDRDHSEFRINHGLCGKLERWDEHSILVKLESEVNTGILLLWTLGGLPISVSLILKIIAASDIALAISLLGGIILSWFLYVLERTNSVRTLYDLLSDKSN